MTTAETAFVHQHYVSARSGEALQTIDNGHLDMDGFHGKTSIITAMLGCTDDAAVVLGHDWGQQWRAIISKMLSIYAFWDDVRDNERM